MLVDYLVYAGNSAIVSREGIVTQEYALEGNLIIIFSKVISFRKRQILRLPLNLTPLL